MHYLACKNLFLTWKMVNFLTFFNFFELRRFHMTAPGTRPICYILSHQTKSRITTRNLNVMATRRKYFTQYLAHLLTIAGVMEDSFHLRCFLRSLCSWWADISLWSMKLMVGGMLENRDCLRAGESVRVGFWEI